jgi:hypothetical protein
MSLPRTPIVDFDPWHFLTAPLDDLLARLDASVAVSTVDEPDFYGSILRRDWRLQVAVSGQLDVIERDLAIRGLLAAWFGVDVSGWPLGLAFAEFQVPA